MSTELKVRVENASQIMAQIEKAGAKLIRTETLRYTYFQQPSGKVLKLTRAASDTYETAYALRDSLFTMTKHKPVDDFEQALQKLTELYGIKKQLTNRRLVYTLDPYEISLNHLDELGDFLILEGEDPTQAFLRTKLGIYNPDIVTKSFDEL